VLLFRRGWEEFRELRAADLRTFAFLGFTGLFVSTGGTYLGIGNPLLDGPQDDPRWGEHYKTLAQAAREGSREGGWLGVQGSR